jgi:phage protein D
MAKENTSPEQRILINGVEIPPDLVVDILEILVAQYVEGGDRFEIVVNALNSTNLQLKWIDDNLFAPGNVVEIQAGYPGQLQTLIIGEITALAPRFNDDKAAQVIVQGFDRLHRLRRGRKTRVFTEVKDSQIAEQVAKGMKLSAKVEDSGVVHHYVLQANLNDIDFLMSRARRIRYEVIVSDKDLIFRRAANHLGQTLTFEYMTDLKWFAARLSTVRQVSEVSVRGWNPATKEAILGVGRESDVTTRMGGSVAGPRIAQDAFGQTTTATVDLPIESQAEADQIAKAFFNDMAILLIQGEGEVVGNPALRAGTTIELKNLGKRFQGVYYVRKAEHRISPQSGYLTRFEVQRNAS